MLRPHYNVTVRFQARFLSFESSAHRFLCMLSGYQVAKVQRCWSRARFLSSYLQSTSRDSVLQRPAWLNFCH